MGKTKGASVAKKLLYDCGIDDPTTFPLDLLVSGRGAYLEEAPLKNADGRIIFGKRKAIIKVNSNIKYEGRKRFAIAHELGHFEMHKDYPIHNDANSLNWFDETLLNFKNGKQELEANEFAAELLMPEELFVNIAKGNSFSPNHLRSLADKFKTSITSAVFRCVEFDVFPICVFFITKGKVKYWKKSPSFKVWVNDVTRLAPPSDSVAAEYIEENYDFVYSPEESAQEIEKSTWFKDESNNNYNSDYLDVYDSTFYEYCIPMKQYQSIVSIVWVD